MGCVGLYQSFERRDSKDGSLIEVGVCLTCGMVQQSRIPSSEKLRQYYSHFYRADYKRVYTPRLKHVYRAAVAAKNRLEFLSKTLNRQSETANHQTLLDVGAGGGEFVCVAQRFGFEATGLEPNMGYSDFAREVYGIKIDTQHLDQSLDRRADVVTLFHVLEHLPDPDAAFAAFHTMVNPRGWLFVEVPNIEQADASPANIFFRAHLLYFSEATLISLASPYFEPVAIESQGNLRILFKRRDQLVIRQLPTQDQVQQTISRLNEKGWIEYLFAGGGFKKPFWRIRQYWTEFRLRKMTPSQVIDYVMNCTN